MNFIDKDLLSVQEARVLAENARLAQAELQLYEDERLSRALDIVYATLKDNLALLSQMYIEESHYGNYRDSYTINLRLLEVLYDKLRGEHYVGEIRDNKLALPIGGVILLPADKNVLLSIINVLLLSVRTGNTLIIGTSERVSQVCAKCIQIVSEELTKAGYPEDFLSCMTESTKEGLAELINSKGISVVVNAGRTALVSLCEQSGKVFYYGSTAASPVFIERSADISCAVEDIVESRSFNYGTLPGAEQFLVVDEPVVEAVKKAFTQNSCHFLSHEEEEKLIKILLKDGEMNEDAIGISATVLARMAGFVVPEDTKILISYQDYITEFNAYAKALAVPVLVLYKESDWLNACEKCIEILTKEQEGHTLSIYSQDQKIIEQFIYKKPVGRVSVNTNTTFSAMGMDATIFPSSILGAFSRGHGVLSENLEPKHFLFERAVVSRLGVRKQETSDKDTIETKDKLANHKEEKNQSLDEAMEKMLKLFSTLIEG